MRFNDPCCSIYHINFFIVKGSCFFLLSLLLLGAGFNANALSLNEIVEQTESDDKEPTAYVAIIIDDLGYKPEQDQRAINLSNSVTLAFLPHTPYVTPLAEIASSQGNEIMLHLPMQAVERPYVGPGTLTSEMTREQFKISLLKSIISVPHVSGINNHMGSLITSKKQPMNWLMEELARTHLFFVDSRTTVETLAEQTANQFNISNTRRNVFLDHDLNQKAIEFQFDRLIRLAKKEGSAVAIGHPFDETLEVLEKKIPQLKAAGIRLVSVSTLIRQQKQINLVKKK
jgi:uncharacterized protein